MHINKIKLLTIIPARFQSSRFPGKPLAIIKGKPMIVRVYKRAKQVLDEVVVATDSLKIKSLCDNYKIPSIMTSENHKTGTDRLAEIAKIKNNYHYYINIQGDEPIFPFEAIAKLKKEITKSINENTSNDFYSVFNCMSKIFNENDIDSKNVPKVVVSKDNNALYLSRFPIPYNRENYSKNYYKQLGIYAFSNNALRLYAEAEQGNLEKLESIEILRFLEIGKKVKMILCNNESYSVDTPEDINKIEHLISMWE